MNEPEKYTMETHSSRMVKGIPWRCCKYCGLVYLNNDISRLCVKLGCNYTLSREYKSWRKTINKDE